MNEEAEEEEMEDKEKKRTENREKSKMEATVEEEKTAANRGSSRIPARVLTSSGAEPISVGREGEGVDSVASVESVEMFAFVEIPQHGLAVFATGSAEGAVGRNGDGVQITSVTDVIRLQLAVGQVPHLGRWERAFVVVLVQVRAEFNYRCLLILE